MAYYTDTCDGNLIEYDPCDLWDAKIICEHALQSARDFETRMGFRPFWADAVEIRRGKAGLGSNAGSERNAKIVAQTTLFKGFKV